MSSSQQPLSQTSHKEAVRQLIKSKVSLAPMAGITDYVLRSQIKKYSPDCLLTTEMISSEFLAQARSSVITNILFNRESFNPFHSDCRVHSPINHDTFFFIHEISKKWQPGVSDRLRYDFIPPLSVAHICMPASECPLLPSVCIIWENHRKTTSICKKSTPCISKEGTLLCMFISNKDVLILD